MKRHEPARHIETSPRSACSKFSGRAQAEPGLTRLSSARLCVNLQPVNM